MLIEDIQRTLVGRRFPSSNGILSRYCRSYPRG
jgi:hypothetical protein